MLVCWVFFLFCFCFFLSIWNGERSRERANTIVPCFIIACREAERERHDARYTCIILTVKYLYMGAFFIAVCLFLFFLLARFIQANVQVVSFRLTSMVCMTLTRENAYRIVSHSGMGKLKPYENRINLRAAPKNGEGAKSGETRDTWLECVGCEHKMKFIPKSSAVITEGINHMQCTMHIHTHYLIDKTCVEQTMLTHCTHYTKIVAAHNAQCARRTQIMHNKIVAIKRRHQHITHVGKMHTPITHINLFTLRWYKHWNILIMWW